MKTRVMPAILILAMIVSLLASAYPVKADNRFLSPDSDGDGISNEMETAGWYITSYGPYRTDPNKADTDGDGLSDGEEKLFNTGPTDAKSPGIAVKYDKNFKTIQYFSVSDGKYQTMVRGGDQYLMRYSIVIRRGTTFNLIGPATATLTITGQGLSPLTGIQDPVHGGWTVSVPPNGTVGTYTATFTLGTWTKSMPIYVIFELPSDLPADQVAAFLYDDDPANKKDEVAVWFKAPESQYTTAPCPDPANPDAPCSNWQYRNVMAYTQAFWTEQYTNFNFITHTMKAINGATNVDQAAQAIADWSDKEFRVNYTNIVNSFSSALTTWNDGTGITMNGGGCESTAGVFNAMLRSAGIASRIFTVDYNKTAGHGEPDWLVGSAEEYDNSVMFWSGHQWKGERNYADAEWKYYPYSSGSTGIFPFSGILSSGDWYYNDQYGDLLVSIGPGWDFQNGSNGGGMVNTVWTSGPPSAEWSSINRDYLWDSRTPLQIVQSPNIELFNCQIWRGDNWAPSEWSGTSNPAGRSVVQSYNLPSGIPDPANPIENWPYNPQPTACSASTTQAACDAFKANWSNVCTPYSGQASSLSSNALLSITPSRNSSNENNANAAANLSGSNTSKFQTGTPVLGKILDSYGFDQDNDSIYDELIVKFEVTSPLAGRYQFGGWLRVGDTKYRFLTTKPTLTSGKQTVEIAFDGKLIGDKKVKGPYKVEALWVAPPDQPILHIVEPDKMLDYQKYNYSTKAFRSDQFKVTAAVFADNYSHQGIDKNKDGLYEAIQVNTPLNISHPGKFKVEGDLYDGQAELVGHAIWTGNNSNATLQFNVANTTPPYIVEHLMLTKDNGEFLDSRYAQVHEITDLGGKIEGSSITLAAPQTSLTGRAGLMSVTPTSYTVVPVDANNNGMVDKLVVNVGVTVTNTLGSYRIEGLLEDENNIPVAWSVSGAQVLANGSQQMTLEFDGKMLYDQLPLANDPHSFKLVALRIYSGTNPSSTTVQATVPVVLTTNAYSRSQFEPSSTSLTLFQDDLESGDAKWSTNGSLFNLTTDAWRSWSHAWVANTSSPADAILTLTTPLDLSNYAGPAIKFTTAYRMASANDYVDLEASTDGTTWNKVTTYTGTTTYWTTQLVDLTSLGKNASVSLRFNAHAQSGLLFYIDDVYLNAWPAVTTASYTYTPTPVVAGSNATFTASYTSIDTTLPVTYSWNFGDGTAPVLNSTNPSVIHKFTNPGDYTVELTVKNAYDSAIKAQSVHAASPGGEYTLMVSAGAGGTVTKNPNLTYYPTNTSVALTANAATGYTFSGWGGDLSGSTNPATIVMNANKTISASFTQNQYTLETNLVGQGSIAKDPDQPAYTHGQQLTLTATAAVGWTFSAWGGACTGTEACVVMMDGNKSVTATFTENQYTLSTDVVGQGSVAKDPNQATYTYNQTVAVTATPAAGWSFIGWSGACTGTGACSVMMNDNKSVTATFTQNEYALTVTSVNGAVTKSPDQATYHYGDTVSLTANGDPGYTFSSWSGDVVNTTNPVTVTIHGNTDVTANFTQNEYTLTVTTDGQGSVSRDKDGPYHYGDTVQLTATADTGWAFADWTGDLTGSANPGTITMDGNKTIVAHFTEGSYQVTVSAGTGGSVKKSPDQAAYTYGTSVTLTATAEVGYKFNGWSGDLTSNVNPVIITVDGNKTIAASFTQEEYTLTTHTSGQGSVSLNNSGPYYYGDSIQLTATPAAGWLFSEWSGDLSGSTNPATITMNGNRDVTATFTAEPCSIAALIGAIDAANLSGQPTTITLDADCTYTLTGPASADPDGYGPVGLPPVTGDITLQGSNTTITRSGTTPFRFFYVATTGSLTLENLTISNGLAQGGNGGNAQFDGAGGAGGLGGAIFNRGALTLTNVTLTGNKAIGGNGGNDISNAPASDGGGGGMGGGGQDGQGSNNGGKGGGINGGAGGTQTSLSGVPGGVGGGGGGAAFDGATQGNGGEGGFGGGGGGGAIGGTGGFGGGGGGGQDAARGGTPGFGGGRGQAWTGGGGAGFGGAVFNDGGTLTLTDSTFSSNTAQGGNGTVGSGGDNPTGTGGGGSGYGGAIFNHQGTLQISSPTYTGNAVVAGTGGVNGSSDGIDVYDDAALTLTLNIIGQGTVAKSPDQSAYTYGTAVTLTPSAATGYTFTGWSGACSGSGACVVTMNGNQTVEANFTISTYTLMVDAINGTVTRNPDKATYTHGEVVELYATPVEGYTFNIWTGDLDSEANPATIVMDGNKSVSATFTQNTYKLIINPATGGTITVDPVKESYLSGEQVTLTAAAGTGYVFTTWTGDASGSTSPTTITMDKDKTVGGTFEKSVVTLTIETATGGTITASPDGPYHYGDEVTLTATPDTGYTFTSWTGDLSGTTNPASLTLDGNKTVGADFTQNTYTLAVVSDHGAVSKVPDQSSYTHGSTVQLTMGTVESGWTFTGWSGGECTGTDPCTVTMTSDTTVTAVFTHDEYTLTINQSAGGTVTASPAGPYHYGDLVTLTATANTGYGFTSWTGDASGATNPSTITMNGNKTVGAAFEKSIVTLTINPAIGGAITASPDGPYHYGDEVTLTATPDTGYTFTSWTGDSSSTTSPTTITLNGDKTVGATFDKNLVTLTINQTAGGTITSSPAEPYHYGDTVTLEASANPGYSFKGWIGDLSGTTNPATLILYGNKSVSGTFEQLANTKPILAAIGDQAAKASNPLTFTATATDSDVPAQTLTFSLDAGAPTGANIDPNTGVFTWVPTATQAQGSYPVTVRVTDNGTPAESASEMITITAADWSENWDSYPDGTQVHGVNGWAGWHGDPNASAPVSSVQYHSAPQSILIQGTTDLTHTYVGYTSGKWIFTAWNYVPPEGVGAPYFILMNAYPETSNGSWSVQTKFDPGTGVISNEMGSGGSLPMVKGRWVKLALEIDLDADIQRFYYDGQLLYQAPWSTSSMGTGIKSIGAIDLYANSSSPVYYDDLSLTRAQTLTTTVTGSGSITRSPNQSVYVYGDEVTLTALPEAGWSFSEWGGACSGSGACVVTMNGDQNVTATFTQNTYTLTVTSATGGTINVDPVKESYLSGEQVTLTAMPDTGYTFVAWTGNASGTTSPTTITMDGNRTVGATFEKSIVTLTINPTMGGTITAAQTGTYHYGDDVTLTATPDTGYTFISWTGDASGTTNPTTITLNGNMAVGANFTLIPPTCFTLALAHTGEGADPTASPANSTSCAAGNYVAGEAITFSGAVPLAGWQIDSWLGTADDTSQAASNTVTMPAANHTVKVNYTQSEYTVTVTAGTGGTVTKTPDQATYHLGETVTLETTTSAGYTFSGWTGDFTGTTSPVDITVSGNMAIAANFTQNTYTLTIETVNGSVTRNPDKATYTHGELVLLTPVPAGGYTFINWTGDLTSEANPATITMDANKSITANFALITPTCYPLTLSHAGEGSDPAASPANSSSCAAGQFVAGENISLSTTPDIGWKIASWTGTTNDSSMEATNSLTMPASAHSAAVTYAKSQFTLTVTQPDGGTITPATAAYDYGTVVTLTATPAEGHHFVAWTGDCSGSGACSVTMDADKTVSATFAHNIFTLTVNQPTGGTIAPSTADYDYGRVVELTAAPAEGYHFVAWTNACEGQTGLICIVTVTGNLTVGATFELTPVCYALTMVHTGEGSNPVANPTSSTGCGEGSYLEGEHIDLSGATPAEGYEINSWTGTTADASKASNNTTTMPASAHSVAVNYTQIEYALTVTSAHSTIDVSKPAPYHYNDMVTITMGTVQAGWTFTGWSGAGCSGTSPCTIMITGNTEVTANFTENEYALTITQSTGGTITAQPGGQYHLNDPVTLMATANLGYTFSAWTDDCAGQGNPCTLTMDAAKKVSATFTQIQYALTVISDHGAVSKNPDNSTYTYNQQVVLTMETVNPGWTFTGWTGGDCSGTTPCTVTITGDTTVTAEFSQDDYSLTVAVDPVDSGNSVTLSNTGPTYHYGETVTLTPVAAAGWQFDHWDGAVQNNQVTITGNMVVTAYFVKIPYTLTLNTSPSEGGTVTADKPNPVFYNEVVNVTAAQAPGYTFSHWEGACTGSGTCTVTTTGNATVTAVFTQNQYTLGITINGNGAVGKDPNQETYTYNQVVTLTATADPGWTFTGWDGICTGNGDCQVTMDDNKSVTANFTEDQYILDIAINGSGTVIKSPDLATYKYGDEVTLTATPASGWEISEWSVEGCTGSTCTVAMYGDQSVIITFTQYIEYSLTTSVDPAGSGTIIANPGGPTYPRGTMVQLTVNPEPGYFFDHWTGDCAGQGNPCTVTMNGDETATAYLTHGKVLPKNMITTAGTMREGFESMNGWTISGSGSGYGAVLDTVNVKEGTASIKLTTPSSGNVTITKAVNWDLSADQGNIRFWVYDSGTAEPSGGSIILYTNTSNYYTTSYGGAFKLRYRPGWNLISLSTSDWKATGSPSWGTITSIRIRLDSRAANTYSFDGLTSGVVAQPAVIFTFDKGLTSLYTQAFSYMSSRNVRGTGYVITNLAGTTGYARWDQLQAMKAAGWTVGSQTMSNVDLTTLNLAGQTAELEGAMAVLTTNGLDPLHVAYPGGKYNSTTLMAMMNLGMYTGRSLLTFNNVSPLASPFEIAQRSIVKSTTLSTAQSWVDTAKARQEVLVITIQGLSASPSSTDWYIARFQSLVSYCISQGIPIITMDDLYQLQSVDITIPEAK